MTWPHPVSTLQLGIFFVIMTVGAVSLISTIVRHRQIGDAKAKSGRSTLGIALQGIGFGAAGFGPIRADVPWPATSSVLSSLLIALLGGAAIALFSAAASAMGRNWSVVARTRADHQLVRSGPFGVVRHPIYLALLLYLISLAVAFGHAWNLLIAVPLYFAGTAIRIHEEEKLLRAQFGDDHARYVREVPAFIPFIR